MSGSSGRWTPIKMAALPWRKFRPSCREPGDRFRGNDLITAVTGLSHSCLAARQVMSDPRRSPATGADMRRVDRTLEGEEPADPPVQAPVARAPHALVVS